MFDGFLKPRFQVKCKSLIKQIKTRLEAVKKKRNAVERYLRNDIADLLKSNLDINAYGRAEGLLVEQNMSCCYHLIEQFCDTLSMHIPIMVKQRECPEDCREAVPSLMYAAARFADLPELRDLRTLFTEKYGNSLEIFISKEFVAKLKLTPPTKEMKLQLMQEIAQEISLDWDSKALDQKLFKPPPPDQKPKYYGSLKDDNDDDGYKCGKSKDDVFSKRDSQDYNVPKRHERNFTSHRNKVVAADRHKLKSSSEDVVVSVPSQTSSSSVGSVSEDEVDSRKSINYQFIPPPYVKNSGGGLKESPELKGYGDEEKYDHKDDLVGEEKPKPRSVRRKNLRPPPGREDISSIESGRNTKIKDDSDEEERKLDGLLMHYSNKPSKYEVGNFRPNLRLPPSRQTADDEAAKHRKRKTEVGIQPARAASLPPESSSPPPEIKGHARAASLQPESLAGHVHPNLPDYDDLAARIASLKG